MTRFIGSCLAMTGAAFLLAMGLLVFGVPGAVLLALAPALVCVGAHLLIGHGLGDADGRDLLETARHANTHRREWSDALPSRYAHARGPATDGTGSGPIRRQAVPAVPAARRDQ